MNFFSEMSMQECFLTSKRRMNQRKEIAKERISRTVAGMTTGQNVS